MDMSDATEGASFWQSHIAAWQQSLPAMESEAKAGSPQ